MKKEFKNGTLLENYNRMIAASNQRLDENGMYLGMGFVKEENLEELTDYPKFSASPEMIEALNTALAAIESVQGMVDHDIDRGISLKLQDASIILEGILGAADDVGGMDEPTYGDPEPGSYDGISR